MPKRALTAQRRFAEPVDRRRYVEVGVGEAAADRSVREVGCELHHRDPVQHVLDDIQGAAVEQEPAVAVRDVGAAEVDLTRRPRRGLYGEQLPVELCMTMSVLPRGVASIAFRLKPAVGSKSPLSSRVWADEARAPLDAIGSR